MRRIIALFVTVSVLLMPGIFPRAGEPAPAYTVLDDEASQLREAFNSARGSVRLLFVVDPICPGCLRGLDDVNQALLADTDDSRLRTFVVHVPVLGAEAKDIEPAGKLVQNSRVHHYWNPSGSFGKSLTEAMELENDGKPVYAWDVWLIYGPEASWDGALPPQPRRMMHQLYALQDSTKFPQLDRGVFAQEVHRLLAQLPPEDSTR